MLRHVVKAIPMPVAWRSELLESPLLVVLNSQGAVQLFFVLSGWVLAASLARHAAAERPVAWLPFYVRRIFRIHVPFVCAALFAFALSRFWSLPDEEAVTRWLRRSLVHPSFGALLASFGFPSRAAGLLPIGWTLTIEMIYSFALPAMVLVARPARGVLLLALAIAGLLSPWHTAWFGLDFALGVIAFQERAAIARAIAAIPSVLRPLLPILGLALLCLPLWYRLVPAGSLPGHTPREIAVMGVGAVLLLLSALSLPRFARAIGCRPFQFLGRISYGVYLLHRPLLTLLAPHVLVPTLLASKLIVIKGVTTPSAIALVALVVAGSIALAVPFHYFVELPAIALGQRLARALERALGLESRRMTIRPAR